MSVTSLEALIERDKLQVPEPDSNGSCGELCVQVAAVADLPTKFGPFKIVAFRNTRDEKEHIALVHGEIVGAERVPTRLHSECLTGDALGSLRCDCRDQLEQGLERLARFDRGMLIYLRQEGRGIGLVNKIRAYALQDRGMDTVEANLALGFEDDQRDYEIAAHMVRSLGVHSVRLMTNNPEKIAQLTQHGVRVAERIAHTIPPTEHNRFYLETKALRSGHWLDDGESPTEGRGRMRLLPKAVNQD